MTNPRTRLEQLQTKSPAPVRAALLVGAMLRAEYDEARRILANVSHVGMVGRDPEFWEPVTMIRETLSTWALDYWQTRARYREVLIVSPDTQGGDHAEILACEWYMLRDRLAALDDALEAVCSAVGIGADDVRRFYGIESGTEGTTAIGTAGQQLAAEYLSLLPTKG
ncbi:hypothetical protein ACKVEX_12520 [Rhodocyclaceae bacterium SMB388]